MAANGIDQNLKALADKCQLLENQCSAYVNALEQTNARLEKEIRKQKQSESRLKASEMKFRKIFEYAPFGSVMTDGSGKIVLANRALCSMTGYSRNELENMHFSDITHADDIDIDLGLVQKLTRGEIDHYRLEKRFRSKKGTTIWGSLAVTLLTGTAPQGKKIIGMVEDISKRKQEEQEMIQSRNDLEEMVTQRTKEIRLLKDRLQAENLTLKRELAESQSYGTIIGQSHPIKTVISQIELVAPTDANVLIHGESGTGKELVAREIHRHSQRKENPMIKVNCATIPKDLYESEFFGHIKGAFTGAVKDRIGRFEAADGGTIFLDEVGEIPLDLQSKLLRILQEGEYERLGEDKTRRVNVRIIAATNKNLLNEVKANRFRDDLFYRLNVFPIHIAPLNARKEDIPLLAAHFICKLSKRLNVQPPRLTQANVLDLQAYAWPGNVRELENAIERAIILTRSNFLNFNALKESSPPAAAYPVDRVVNIDVDNKIFSAEELSQLERQNTINALRRCNWKIYGDGGAANLLGIKPTTLIERIKRMRIQKPGKNPMNTNYRAAPVE
ncbi:sigma-54 interaction domain-containing protein [Desulfosarcina sp.]|uniref:sigma-54 interaction domain-containing protein n=1 Tax=Desulfosarcina sp. TaxID=2027861 RepID=UPI003970A889